MLDLQSPTEHTQLSPQALDAFFTTLQEYPDFLDGLSTGRLAYREIWAYEEAPFTLETLRKEVDESLTEKGYQSLVQDMRSHDQQMKVPYFFLLGFVLGEISESYTA